MIKIGIVGGTGYTGVELLRLLAMHPEADVRAITSRKDAGTKVADMFPSLRGVHALCASSNPHEADLKSCDVVFFATPHGVAMAQARELVGAGVKIIDLAADFRLKDPAVFEKWYGMPHTCTDLLAESVYGLPEVNRASIKGAAHRRQPGLLSDRRAAGLPAAARGGDRRRRASRRRLQVRRVRRRPQGGDGTALRRSLRQFQGVRRQGPSPPSGDRAGARGRQRDQVGLVFTPHLVPMIRGIHATLYARLIDTSVDLQALFEKRYADEPFVDVMPAGSTPDTRSVRAATSAGSPFTGRKAAIWSLVLAVEDNLVKGAAGPGDPEHEPDVRTCRRPPVSPRCRCCRRVARWPGPPGGAARASISPSTRRGCRCARACRGLGAPSSGVGLLAVVAGMWWWGFDFGQIFGGFNRKEIESRIASLEAENAQLRTETAQLRTKATRLESELAMADGRAGVAVEAGAGAPERELADQGGARLPAEARRRLQQAGRARRSSGVVVEREREDAWHYSLLLVRGGNPKDEFDGHVTLQVTVQPAPIGGVAPQADDRDAAGRPAAQRGGAKAQIQVLSAA